MNKQPDMGGKKVSRSESSFLMPNFIKFLQHSYLKKSKTEAIDLVCITKNKKDTHCWMSFSKLNFKNEVN